MTQPVIEFANVYRRFRSQAVLEGLTLQVEAGTVYALLGRNGCGKSTAIRTLLGFIEPHHGASRVLGVDSQHLAPAHRQQIGYVTEGHRLYGAAKVKGILAFEAGTRPEFDLQSAQRCVERFGLGLSKRVMRLSRGQRAQLALICAVSARPRVLIMDDPALGLDVVMRREFLDVMIDLLGAHGASVLLSSHVMSDVERIADRIGILHGGRLIVDATLDDLKRRVVRRFWRSKTEQAPPRAAQILKTRATRGGFDLTLLDADDPLEARLRACGELGEISRPSLEEVFLDLVSQDLPPDPSPATREEVYA